MHACSRAHGVDAWPGVADSDATHGHPPPRKFFPVGKGKGLWAVGRLYTVMVIGASSRCWTKVGEAGVGVDEFLKVRTRLVSSGDAGRAWTVAGHATLTHGS
jgi:hypothetical protein